MSTNLKVAAMDDLKATPNVQKIEEAFDRFASRRRIMIPARDHLGSWFESNLCCDHRWRRVEPPDAVAYVLRKHEEEHAEQVDFCTSCGATALREDGRIFSYDVTFQYPPRPQQQRDRRPNNGKR